jgi:hypothetical protein
MAGREGESCPRKDQVRHSGGQGSRQRPMLPLGGNAIDFSRRGLEIALFETMSGRLYDRTACCEPGD